MCVNQSQYYKKSKSLDIYFVILSPCILQIIMKIYAFLKMSVHLNIQIYDTICYPFLSLTYTKHFLLSWEL